MVDHMAAFLFGVLSFFHIGVHANCLSEWGVTQSWPELDVFLQLPGVSEFSAHQKRDLSGLLLAGQKADFEAKCEYMFREQDVEWRSKIDHSIEEIQGEDWDFPTLINQVFTERPLVATALESKDKLRLLDSQNVEGQMLDVFGSNLILVGSVKEFTKPSQHHENYSLLVKTDFDRRPMEVEIAADFSAVSVKRLLRPLGMAKAWEAKMLSESREFSCDPCPFGPEKDDKLRFQIIKNSFAQKTVELQVRSGARLKVQFGEAAGRLATAAEQAKDTLDALSELPFKSGVSDMLSKLASDLPFDFDSLPVHVMNKAKAFFKKRLLKRDVRMPTRKELVKIFTQAVVQAQQTEEVADDPEDSRRTEMKSAPSSRLSLPKKLLHNVYNTMVGKPSEEDAQLRKSFNDLVLIDQGKKSDHGVTHENVAYGSVATIRDAESGRELWKGSFAELDYAALITSHEHIVLEGIHTDTFDSLVHLREIATNANDREAAHRELEDRRHDLRQNLKRHENILHSLLQVRIKGFALDEHVVADGELGPQLRRIEDMYHELGDKRSKQQILMETVEDALYEQVVNRNSIPSEASQSPVVVNEILSNLEAAEEHIENMAGKRLVLLVGDTGSGKSTSASYFLGIPLESVETHHGRGYIHDSSTGPRIGTSWIASETIHATGYHLPKFPNHVLVDSPGFEDTRGPDYGVITGLSLDRAFSKANGVSAVVLLVPYTMFFETRGQAFLELLGRLVSRFPELLKPGLVGKQGEDQGLHILVTKGDKCSMEQIQAIENGKIAKEALQTCEATLTRVRASNMGVDTDSLSTQCDMWRTVLLLSTRKRVKFIHVKDKAARTKLLKQYTQDYKTPSYGSSLNDPKLQKYFGDVVTRHAHSWEVQLITRYMNNITEYTQDSEKRIQATNQELDNSRQHAMEKARTSEHELQRVKAEMEQLKKCTQKGGDCDAFIGLLSKGHEDRIARAKREVANHQTLVQEAQSNLDKASSELNDSEQRESELRTEMQNLGEGYTDDDLFYQDFSRSETINTQTCRQEEREAALREIRELDQSACTDNGQLHIPSYSGGMWDHVYLSKDYRLVPMDKDLNEEFQKSRSSELTLGQTVAKVFGVKFKLTGRGARPDGKNITYQFDYTFDAAEPYPWVRVVHKIPNHEFNSAKIISLDGQLANQVERKATYRARKASAEEDLEMRQKDLTRVLETLNSSKKEVQEDIAANAGTRLQHQEQLLIRLTEAARAASASAAGREATLKARLGDLARELYVYKREKVYLAFMIRTHMRTAKVLLKMADFVTQILTSGTVNKNEVFARLSSFKKCYHDAERRGIEKLVAADLTADATAFLNDDKLHEHKSKRDDAQSQHHSSNSNSSEEL